MFVSLKFSVLENYNLFMNNFTINSFQSIVYTPLFLITSCFLSDRLLILLKLISTGFELKKFSTNIFA